MARRRFVWSVDWPWLLVLWPVLLVKGLFYFVGWSLGATVKATVWFYRWAFTGRSRRA